MKRPPHLPLIFLIAVLVTLAVLAVHPARPVPLANGSTLRVAGAISAQPVAIGVYEYHSPWDGGVQLDQYAAMAGQAPAIAMWYEDWPSEGFDAPRFDAVYARGETPILSWDPCHNNLLTNGQLCTDQAIANGASDSYLTTWARQAATYGKRIVIRLAWEMNTNWTPYAPGVNGNTSASYIAMWRHVHDVFVANGATNVTWFWCPNSDSSLGVPMTQVYPGDAYVDYVGFDAYNYGTTQSWSSWSTVAQTFSPPYTTLVGLTTKPIIVGETGSVEQGGSKADWFTSGFLSDVPATFPRIRAITYFDASTWAISTSVTSVNAWQTVVAAPLYRTRFDGALGTPVATGTPAVTGTATALLTSTAVPTQTPLETPTAVPSMTAMTRPMTETATPVPTLDATVTETAVPTPTETAVPTPTLPETATPTETVMPTPTETAVPTPVVHGCGHHRCQRVSPALL